MEINRKLILKESVDSDIRSNGTLMSPDPGVAYVRETEKVYFNRAVLPQGRPRPREALTQTLDKPRIDIEG